jgi:PilZ domain
MERFSALVLSHDVDVLRVINKALEEYGLEANIARSVREANDLLKQRRFDLAVCDYDLPGAQQLTYLEPTSAWRGMVFAVVRPNHLAELHGLRVHLTLSKPLTSGLFGKGLKAAYCTMAHERRAAMRYPVEAPASSATLVHRGETRSLPGARVVNISKTGMCIATREMLPQHATVRAAFSLPRSGEVMHVAGNVAWTKAPGQAGIRFTHVPPSDQKALEEWLQAQLPRELSAVG